MTAISINDVLGVVRHLGPQRAILIRADHGLGKSSVVKQIHDQLCADLNEDRPYIDRRLSQMQGGDILGLPKLGDKSTQWLPPDWFVMACERPCTLFLDELNRAETDVTNSAFQLILDREVNGHRLHPETRVFAAINTDSRYNVHIMDPAMLDRFWVGDLVVDVQDWLHWARNAGLHPTYCDWIAAHPDFLRPPAEYDVAVVQPTPRSHEFTARAVHNLIEKNDTMLVYRIAGGFIGTEAATSLKKYLESEIHITASDVLQKYTSVRHNVKKERVDMMQNLLHGLVKLLASVDRLASLGDPNVLGPNIEAFLNDCYPELRPVFFSELVQSAPDKDELIVDLHPYFYRPIVTGFGIEPGVKGFDQHPQVHDFK